MIVVLVTGFNKARANNNPMGESGTQLVYRHSESGKLPGNVVRQIELTLGKKEIKNNISSQWFHLSTQKENGESFQVWLLCSEYPAISSKTAREQVGRYILQVGDNKAIEYTHHLNNTAILPTTGAWSYLIPRDNKQKSPFETNAKKVQILGHNYQLKSSRDNGVISLPETIHQIQLSPDLLIGVPHNTRQKDETRLYDESDYELIPLLKEDYKEMIESGFTCFRVDTEQLKWIEDENVYYWGIGSKDIKYPEDLYKSNYIGPALYFDEPMVRTKDYVVKPKLKKDPSLRKSLTVQKMLEEFKALYHETKYEEGPTRLIKGLKDREDVDTGDMDFLQQNLYTWETMVSSAIYQLSEGETLPPNAMVFEPPGRFGSRRVLPELNMCFDCQIPVDYTKNLSDMVFSFLRGAARLTGKEWGTSIYGAVDERDIFWLLTHAYDLGATRFFYWDNYQLACVPYSESLAMTKHLRAHIRNNPYRNMDKLKKSAEIAILLPPGYNLGHVYMGRGGLWALPELHRERLNQFGVAYRQVMSNFYTEVERCLRLGIEFDSFWHLDKIKLEGYREVIDIREDGKVEIRQGEKNILLERARIPERPEGEAPKLTVDVSVENGNVLIARANVIEGSAPIFYTQGADKNGVYNNIYVLWELFGPEEEDYYYPWTESWQIKVDEKNTHVETEIKLPLKKPGTYRLRAATSDLAGRSTVVWKEVQVGK